MIYIVDYQSGNLGAIQNMFKKIGARTKVVSDPTQLQEATKIVLPGIGAFDTAMQCLLDGGWIPYLESAALEQKIPTLGICLGMQLLTKGSEEGVLDGLGWINGFTKRFSFGDNLLKIPHMGWNEVTVSKVSALIKKEPNFEHRFYFAHSYFVKLNDSRDELLRTSYGIEFSSALERDNIVGFQFHPERSHRFGMGLLQNFVTKF